ncbi:MAG: M23 family metallopeptidase [Tepidisphaeraceae bacterium]|jgi:hypothetical protein
MNYRRRIDALIACICLIILGTDLTAHAAQSVQLETTRQADTIVFSAQGFNCTEATLTIDLTLDNMTASCPTHVSVDYERNTLFPALILTPIDARRPWHFRYTYKSHVGCRRHGSATQPADYDYGLPYRRGETHFVMQGAFGTFSHFKGTGDEQCIDFQMPVGTIICAARPGQVVGIKDDSDRGGPTPQFKDDANYIVIQHDDGTYGLYEHLCKGGSLVTLGEIVNRGQPIGKSGCTGWASGPHLHFGVYNNLSGSKWFSYPLTFTTPNGSHQTLLEGNTY